MNHRSFTLIITKNNKLTIFQKELNRLINRLEQENLPNNTQHDLKGFIETAPPGAYIRIAPHLLVFRNA